MDESFCHLSHRDFDPDAMSFKDQYKLVTGSVIPRPIALVTTIGPDGPNAAPFSFFNCFAIDPPTLLFSASPREGHIKDTVRNIRHTPEFVIHIVDADLKDQMNICAIDFPLGTNEMKEAGFRTAPSRKVRPPRILDCPVHFECRLVDIMQLGRVPYELVIGRVVHMHFREDLLNDRLHVDPGKLNALGRLAGDGGYTRITDRFIMPFLKEPGTTPGS
jgi:flavin reductase (DIM6/NTAB) family NADH-FMN oxidoreductase RutF